MTETARERVARRCHGRCEAHATDGCTGRFEHAHHVRLRSQGGGSDPGNLLAVCHVCHDWIHGHPADAYRRGLLARTVHEPSSSAVTSVTRLPFDHRGDP